jgi:hypothetical protein
MTLRSPARHAYKKCDLYYRNDDENEWVIDDEPVQMYAVSFESQ